MPTVFTSNFVGFTKIKGKSKMKPLVMCENGGCLAKVGGSELTRLIGELFGEFAPEDSSLFTIDGADMLFNLDFGPLIGDDAYEAGKISAHHSISDIYVSAGTPMYASIMLQIAQDITYGQTKQILAGIKDVCDSEGIKILGGHTIRSESSVVGLSVIGKANKDYMNRSKQQCVVGDKILLSKKLGAGIASRAYFHKMIDKDAYSEAIASMTTSNKGVLKVFESVPVHACTDVTGFGFLGHLSETLSKDMGAVIYEDKIRIFDCIAPLPAGALYTSFIEDNINYVLRTKKCNIDFDTIETMALADPQTNGPVLLTVAPEHVEEVEKLGFYVVGETTNDKKISLR